MTDLDRAIRARLDDCALPGMRWIPVMGLTTTWPTTDFAAFQRKAVRLESAPGQMRDALLAVLDLHPAEPHECPAGRDGYGQITGYDATCLTLRTIAEKLGVDRD